MWAVATTGIFDALAKSMRYSISSFLSMQRSVALLPTTKTGRAAFFIMATATSGFVIGFAFFVAAISAHCQGSHDISFSLLLPSYHSRKQSRVRNHCFLPVLSFQVLHYFILHGHWYISWCSHENVQIVRHCSVQTLVQINVVRKFCLAPFSRVVGGSA